MILIRSKSEEDPLDPAPAREMRETLAAIRHPLYLDGQQQLIGVLALDITGGQITHICSIVNPDKLTHLGPVADFRSLLRSAR